MSVWLCSGIAAASTQEPQQRREWIVDDLPEPPPVGEDTGDADDVVAVADTVEVDVGEEAEDC